MKWQPAKPRERIKVVECGRGTWDERDHGPTIRHSIECTDFKVTGTVMSDRTRLREGCDRRTISGLITTSSRSLRIAAGSADIPARRRRRHQVDGRSSGRA